MTFFESKFLITFLLMMKNSPRIHHASRFNLKHFYVGDVHKGNNGRKYINFQQGKNNRGPVLLQFSGKGKIPANWGVSTNDYGSTKLTFNVADDAEYNGMKAFEKKLIALAISNKDQWWGKKGITQSQIQDNFYSVVSEKKEKKDGNGHWPGSVKVTIPTNMDTGEASRSCSLRDVQGEKVEVNDISGRHWERIIIQITGIFFTGKYNWGISKKLVKIQVQTDETLTGEDLDWAALDEECIEPPSKKLKISM